MVTYQDFDYGAQYDAESTYGTDGTVDTSIGRVQNYVAIINNNIIHRRGVGAGRLVQQHLYGNLDVSLNFTYDAHEWDFLQHAVGQKTGSGTTASPYILTRSDEYAVGGADIDPFTLEISSDKATDDVDTFLGCTIDSFTVSGSLGQPISIGVTATARTVTNAPTITAYTEPTTKTWMFYQGTFKWGTSPATVGRVQSFQIIYNNNRIVYHDDGRFISIPTAGPLDFIFQLTAIMTETVATTLRDDFYGTANTPTTAVSQAIFTEGNEFQLLLSEGGSSTQREVEIKLDDCSLDTYEKPIPLGNGLVQVTFGGQAYNAVSSQVVKWWTVT